MTTKQVAFLGPEASFTHLATKSLFQARGISANSYDT